MTKFKEFWKDYFELWRANREWMKKHWLGYIILVLFIFTSEFAWIFRESILDWVKNKFTKTKIEEVIVEEEEESL